MQTNTVTPMLHSDIAIANAETEVYEAEEGRSDVDKRSAQEVVRQEALSIITETPSVVNRRIAVQWQLDW